MKHVRYVLAWGAIALGIFLAVFTFYVVETARFLSGMRDS